MGRYKSFWSWAFFLAVAAALAACKPKSNAEAPEIRPVRTVTATHAISTAINDRLRRASAGRIVRE